MELSPLDQQRLENAYQTGLQQGIKQGKRLLIESFFRFRFGELDEELSAIIEPLLDVPTEEITPLVMQLSRDELIARFRN